MISVSQVSQYQDGELTLVTVPVVQHGRTLHVGALSASTAHALFEAEALRVDVWTEANQDGYQRSPVVTRYRKFGRFIQQTDGISPTSALLYLRNPTVLEATNGHNGAHVLVIKATKSNPLYIPDGQHRLLGLKEAFDAEPGEVADFSLPVTLMVAEPKGDARFEEAQQFFLINSNQKRVPTDLAQRYLLRYKEQQIGQIDRDEEIPMGATNKELMPYATRVVDLLNNDPSGPWKGKIALPNSSDSKQRPISQNSFNESIVPILRHASEYGWNVGMVVDTLAAFWEALGAVCPEAAEHWSGDPCPADPAHTDYNMRKTSGVFSLNDVLAWLLGISKVAADPTDPGVYRSILAADPEHFSDEWWNTSNENGASGYGTSRKAFKTIRDEIVRTLAPDVNAF